MRKYKGLILGTTILFALLAVSAAARAAEILFVQGSVQVQSPDDEEWKKAEKGMQVNIGDTIRTARHSKVDIALDTGKMNTIQLGERSLAVLNSATADSIDRLDLARGRVYSNMEGIKSGLSFEVTTPSAVAGVRGSSYMVYVERDQDEVAAYKDTVFIKSFDSDKKQLADVMLPEGFKTFIERFSEPSALLQVSLREFDRFDGIRNDLISRSEGKEPVRREREPQRFEEDKSVIEKLTDQAADQGAVTDALTETKDSTEDSNTQQQIDERVEPSHESEEEGYHFTSP